MDWPSNDKILMTVSASSILLPIGGGLYAFKKLTLLEKKLLVYFIVFGFIEFAVSWLSRHNINNMPLFHAFSFIEYLFVAYVFYHTIHAIILKKIILILSFIYLCFTFFALYYFSGIFKFNTETRILEAILLVFFSLLYFNQLSKELTINILSVFRIPMFWVSSSIFLYFTGNFFLFLFIEHLSNIKTQIWSLHSVMNIMCNALFMVSFLCKTK
jgi:hypothetical protein